MSRNFFRRVEIVFPVEDPALRERIVNKSSPLQLADNTKAWHPRKPTAATRPVPRPKDEPKRDSQAEFMALALGEVRPNRRKPRIVRPKLKPRTRPR